MHTATPTNTDPRTRAYDKAAGKWSDKMRALGYYDAYLGMLSAPGLVPASGGRVADVGAGTGAFAEAWAAVNGAPDALTLIDPSAAMLTQAQSRLQRRNVRSSVMRAGLHDLPADFRADNLLAAHVIEHFPDTDDALARLARHLRPGGLLWLVASKPHWCNAIIWLQWRHRTFSHARMAQHLDAVGLELVADYTFPSGPPSRTSMGFVARRPA